MTVLHLALFKWQESTTDDQVTQFEHALDELSGQIDFLRRFRFGRDLGEREGNYDFGVVAELDGPERIHDYLDHPAHLRLVEQHVNRMLLKRRAVQFQYDGPGPMTSLDDPHLG